MSRLQLVRERTEVQIKLICTAELVDETRLRRTFQFKSYIPHSYAQKPCMQHVYSATTNLYHKHPLQNWVHQGCWICTMKFTTQACYILSKVNQVQSVPLWIWKRTVYLHVSSRSDSRLHASIIFGSICKVNLGGWGQPSNYTSLSPAVTEKHCIGTKACKVRLRLQSSSGDVMSMQNANLDADYEDKPRGIWSRWRLPYQ